MGGHLSFFSSSPLPSLTVGNLKGMLCLQGATVLYGCVLLYTSFYKFALHKLSVVRTAIHALGRRPGLGADLCFPGVDLLPGCVDCYAKLSLSAARGRSPRQCGTPAWWNFLGKMHRYHICLLHCCERGIKCPQYMRK